LLIHVKQKILFIIFKICRLPAPYCKPEFLAGARLHLTNSKKASGGLASIIFRKPISLLWSEVLLDF